MILNIWYDAVWCDVIRDFIWYETIWQVGRQAKKGAQPKRQTKKNKKQTLESNEEKKLSQIDKTHWNELLKRLSPKVMNILALYNTILYYTILYYTILYYTILYYTILYYTIL